MSDIEKATTDNAETKPKKVYKRKFEFTPARKEAFERCRKARQESIKVIDKKKKIKSVLKREEKIKKKKQELGIEPEVTINFPCVENSSSSEEEAPKPKRKTKVKIVEDNDLSSDSEFEYVVKRVSNKPPSPKQPEVPEIVEPIPQKPIFNFL